MPVKLDTSGLDRFRKNLKKISGEHTVSETDLFPDSFVARNTAFPTLTAMREAAGANSREEVNSDAFSQFVARHSRFTSWREMLTAAYAAYAKRTLSS